MIENLCSSCNLICQPDFCCCIDCGICGIKSPLNNKEKLVELIAWGFNEDFSWIDEDDDIEFYKQSIKYKIISTIAKLPFREMVIEAVELIEVVDRMHKAQADLAKEFLNE